MVPLFTLSIPMMPVYDWLCPWPDAVAAVKEEKPSGLRWMVGYAFESERINGELTHFYRKRDFVVFPAVFRSATVYEFSEGTGVPKELKPRPYLAFGYLLMYAGMISFSWFVSVRKIKWLFRFPKWPNQAPEPTPLLVTDRADARSAPSKGVAHL